MKTLKLLALSLLSTALLALTPACSPGPMPEKYVNAAEARAKAVCDCKKAAPLEGRKCVKAAEAKHAEPEGRPPKQDVSEGSWAAYSGFRKVATKCSMAVNTAYAAAKDKK